MIVIGRRRGRQHYAYVSKSNRRGSLAEGPNSDGEGSESGDSEPEVPEPEAEEYLLEADWKPSLFRQLIMSGMASIMASRAIDKEFECPVCKDNFTEPKMLPCTHLVCRKCVICLVSKTGAGAGRCPVCNQAIIPHLTLGLGNEHIIQQVDSLPTDLATVALLEGHKVLRGPHVCGVCEDGVTAVAFCMQCDVKLCSSCAKSHTKIPALKNHVIEELSQLTPQRVAAYFLSTCKSHDDRKAEFYCATCHELICMLCSSTVHRTCAEVKNVADMAQTKRSELKAKADTLRDRELAFSSQIRETRDRFKAMRKKVKDVMDDLQQSVKKRRLELNALIQAEEEQLVSTLGQMEKHRASLKSNAGTVEKLVSTAPDVALLDMLAKLTSRIDTLDIQTETAAQDCKVTTIVDVTIESTRLNNMKTNLANLGKVTTKEIKQPRTRTARSVKAEVKKTE